MTPLSELEKPCPNCGHQNGGHTGGAAKSGWPIYEQVWANATGWCNEDGCGCQSRAAQSRSGTGVCVRVEPRSLK